MNRQFTLYIQQPCAKKIGTGVLSISEFGDARFFSDTGGADSKVLSEMQRVHVSFAGADGIMLNGMQPDGYQRDGRRKFFYQEWLLSY